MSKKYYVVKDQENELTGGVLPFKVLNYVPQNMIFPTNNVAQVSLDGKPIPPQLISAQPNIATPIYGNTYSNTIVSPYGNTFGNTYGNTYGSTLVNPLGNTLVSQYGNTLVNPLGNTLINPSGQNFVGPSNTPVPSPSINSSLYNPLVKPIFNDTVTNKTLFNSSLIQPPVFGPPIIKTGPYFQQQMPGLIKVMVGNEIVNINIPFNQFRNIINDIYFRSQTNNSDLKATFIINGPGLNTSINTSYNNMVQILNHIRKTYGDVTISGSNLRF